MFPVLRQPPGELPEPPEPDRGGGFQRQSRGRRCRAVRWRETYVEIEADAKHDELIREHMGITGASH